MQETKKCNKCGKELPMDRFYKRSSSRDGYTNTCKDCYNSLYFDKQKKTSTELDKMLNVRNNSNIKPTNKELSSYTPRELIEELRSRGYSGKLQITHTITV